MALGSDSFDTFAVGKPSERAERRIGSITTMLLALILPIWSNSQVACPQLGSCSQLGAALAHREPHTLTLWAAETGVAGTTSGLWRCHPLVESPPPHYSQHCVPFAPFPARSVPEEVCIDNLCPQQGFSELGGSFRILLGASTCHERVDDNPAADIADLDPS